jgi:hypothetical protein
MRIGNIPGTTTMIHIVANNMAMWDFAPALLQLATPATIAEIYLATLTVSKANVSEICDHIQAGKIGRMDVICGDYLARTSPTIHGFAVAEFANRPQVRMHTCRNHAKVLAAKFSDGRTVTIEGSNNMRSSRNIEQATVFGHPQVFEFHANWIRRLCNDAGT